MPVRRPTPGDLFAIARDFGMRIEKSEIADYECSMAGILETYDRVEEMPDNLPEVKFSENRDAGYRPEGKQNRHNAWARKARIHGESSGSLADKTVVLKDSILVAGVPMSVGAEFLEGYTPEIDATVVTRILVAGGTIVGKAVCECLCIGGGSHTSWPAPVLNPLDVTRSAGGSSSGSAALVAAGEADMSLGGDQGGSIRIPAAWCGIVGFKPTYGLIPYTGILPIELTADHTGPMTRDVSDNALLLEVVAGADGLDPRQCGAKAAPYRRSLSQGVNGLRIAVIREGFETPESEPGVDAAVRNAASKLEGHGAVVREISLPAHAAGRTVWTPSILEGWLDLAMRRNGCGTNRADVFVASASRALSAWRNNADELPYPIKVQLLAGEYLHRQYNGFFYGKSQNLLRQLRAAYDSRLADFDLLLMPTTPQVATPLPDSGASLQEIWQVALNMNRNTAPFCGTGHPAISVPCGRSENLPVGLMLVGRHWDEGTIYRAAYAIEQSNR